MKIVATKVLPGGNSTIIVESDVEPAIRAKVSNALMSEDYLCAEQVGFLRNVDNSSNADARLEMMGGELCINALRSTAALLYSRDPSKAKVLLESSGFNGVLECSNKEENSQIYTSVRIQCPVNVQIEDSGILVSLEGISHFVQKMEKLPEKQDATSVLQKLASTHGSCTTAPACGFMPYIKEDAGGFRIMPLVYVRDTDSLVFETGCGSGSIATALAVFSQEKENKRFSILQPSGECYLIEIGEEKNGFVDVTLSSPVLIIATSTVFLPSSLL